MNLNAFMELVELRAVPEEKYLDREKAMEAIYIVEYSGKKTCGEVDFSRFTRDQVVLAMSELMSYVSDEAGGDEGNSENLLTEINRIAHFGQKLDGIKPIKAKKKFI